MSGSQLYLALDTERYQKPMDDDQEHCLRSRRGSSKYAARPQRPKTPEGGMLALGSPTPSKIGRANWTKNQTRQQRKTLRQHRSGTIAVNGV